MVPVRLLICTCLVVGRLLAPTAACAAHCAAECSSTAAAPHRHPLGLETQPTEFYSCFCTTSDPASNASSKDNLRSSDLQAVLSSSTKAQSTSGSSDILTTLSLVVLVNNLMPVPLPARWALATTAASWLWLAFNRLLPWLPQTSPPSHAATAATPASGSDAVAAAAGLSPAATAASAAGGIGGDLSTRWWQHALLVLELSMGNAVDSILLMGLMLLPVFVLRRWLAGKRLWHAVPGLSTARWAGLLDITAVAAAAGATEEALDMTGAEQTGDNAAARSLVDGLSMQLQNAGGSAARLAKAMRNIDSSNARRSSHLDSSSSTSSRGSSPHAEGRAGSRGASSSAGSMVSPEQSRLQPATPPLLHAVQPDGSLSAPSYGMRLASPMQSPPTPTNSTSASAAHAQAVHPAAQPDVSHSARKPGALPQDSPSSSSNDISAAAGSVTRVTAADSSGQQEGYAAAPSGSRADSGSCAGGGVSLNLGAIGAIRTLSTRSPQPMYPTRALYNSPFETVVVSCKLAASSSSTRQLVRTTAYAGPSTATQTVGSGVGGTIQVPLSPAQASLASGGHGSSISAQRELRAVVEAAVRQAVAASNVAVLSTTVTSFPGCVHVVATANLTAAALEAAAQSGSEPAEGAEAGSLTGQVVWEQVVQQILTGQQEANSCPDGTSSISRSSTEVQDPAGTLASQGLYLKHLLVQDTAGNIHYLWVSQEAADSGDVGLAATDAASTAGQSSSVYSASPEPASLTSSSSGRSGVSSRATSRIQQILSAATGISISSFALPTDTAAEPAGSMFAATAPASKLLLPPELADALRAAGCGLRVVISGDPQATTAAAGEDLSAPRHLLADHTMWPGSSNWPDGADFDLVQLLPAGVPAATLLQQFGPVLTVNIVASTRQQRAGTAIGAMQTGGEATAGHSAGQGVGTVLADSADVAPVQDQGEGAVRSASGKLHQDIASFVKRLHSGSGAEDQAAPSSDLSTDAETAAGTGTAGQQQRPEQGGIGEHLLLQLPLLLLPSAACMELSQLQQQMAGELFGDAVTAARRHVLPLANDIAAVFSMNSRAAPACAASGSTAPAQENAVQLSIEQKHLMKQLLQYMSDQSLDAVAAAVCSCVGLYDVGSLMQLQEPQQGAVTAAQHSTGLQEIEAAFDGGRDVASAPATEQPAADSSSSAAGSASFNGAARSAHEGESQAVNSRQAAKALEQASAAHEQAMAAQRAAAATESALQLALQQISALSAAAAQAGRQAADAEAAAAAATHRAAAVEQQAERQRAMQLIVNPAGAPAGGAGCGVGIFGLLGGSSWAVSAARSAGTALLGGVMRAAEPPLVPQDVAPRDVLMGFRDERLGE